MRILDDLFKEDEDTRYQMTPRDRRRCCVLAIEPDPSERSILRYALSNLGYGQVVDSASHRRGMHLIKQDSFSHIVFAANPNHEAALDFLLDTLQVDAKIVALPIAPSATVSQVFDMIRAGAKGYLLKPFSSLALDETLSIATKADPVPNLINDVGNDTEAFISITASCLDKLVDSLRDLKAGKCTREEVEHTRTNLKQMTLLARTLGQCPEQDFVKFVTEKFFEIARHKVTRLERLRKQLAHDRERREVHDLMTRTLLE
jgi:DNA-binding NarL/FixJ family response regulator